MQAFLFFPFALYLVWIAKISQKDKSKINMFSPAIQRLIESKSGSFMIPASKIACVSADNPLFHAFLILTKVKYAKIPVLDHGKLVGLLSLAMITDKMLGDHKIDTDVLNHLQVKDVMQKDYLALNVTQKSLEDQLHLLVDASFIPIVDDEGIFQGIITRREWLKAFNYVVHNFDEEYVAIEKSRIVNLNQADVPDESNQVQ